MDRLTHIIIHTHTYTHTRINIYTRKRFYFYYYDCHFSGYDNGRARGRRNVIIGQAVIFFTRARARASQRTICRPYNMVYILRNTYNLFWDIFYTTIVNEYHWEGIEKKKGGNCVYTLRTPSTVVEIFRRGGFRCGAIINAGSCTQAPGKTARRGRGGVKITEFFLCFFPVLFWFFPSRFSSWYFGLCIIAIVITRCRRPKSI